MANTNLHRLRQGKNREVENGKDGCIARAGESRRLFAAAAVQPRTGTGIAIEFGVVAGTPASSRGNYFPPRIARGHFRFADDRLNENAMETLMNRLLTTAVAVALAGAAPLASAQAQNYPTRPVTIVVGVPPGGSTDLVARRTAETMSRILGAPIIVENRPGANAAIATRQVAHAPADGYTLFYNAVNMATNLVGMKDPGYKWSDFESVGGVAYAPYVMFVNTASSKAKTLKEFIDYGKSHPGKLTFASLGPGSSPGLVAERLNGLTGIGYRDVPYKGGSPAMTDLVGGTVDVYFPLANAASVMVGRPNMVIFAVTGDKRSDIVPDVPTFAELGYPQMSDVLFGGMWVAAATPKPIVDKLRKALAETLKDPGFVAALKKAGQAPYEGDHAKFFASMRQVEAITREDYKKFKLEPQ